MPTRCGPNDVLNQMNVTSGTRATLVPDIIGSIIGSQDSSSGALTKVGYLPYGKSASAGPFGFTGQRIDPETGGFYYYRAALSTGVGAARRAKQLRRHLRDFASRPLVAASPPVNFAPH